PLSGMKLGKQILSSYPYPIAVAYNALAEQDTAAGGFGCLLDTFESLIHFLATVAVSAYLRTGLANGECNRQVLERLVKRAWSAGDLFALLRDTVRLAGDCEGLLPYRQLPGYLFAPSGKPSVSNEILASFVHLRNRSWGHGTGRTEEAFAEVLPPNRQRLDEE